MFTIPSQPPGAAVRPQKSAAVGEAAAEAAEPLAPRTVELAEPPAPVPAPSRRLRQRQRFTWISLLIIGGIIAADQISKLIIRESLALGEKEWLSSFFAISHTANDGGAFGFFSGQNTLFAVSAVLALGVVAVYYFFPPLNHWLVRRGLELILAGAVGNLLDRLYQGHVTDFIDFIHFPAFNVADSAISVGVTVIIIAVIFGDFLKRDPRAAQ